MDSRSFLMAKNYLDKKVNVVIDRPLGSKHPRFGFVYEVNYGYIEGATAPDGEELDAYVLGADAPIKDFEGICIAVVHRLEDDDDKLVVVPDGIEISDEEIEKAVDFQEKWFKYEIVRK